VRLAPGKPGEASYHLLAQSLREQILQDRFAAEEPLPTEVALADEHALSRQTVRRAYLELVNEGLVYRVPGRGSFVTSEQVRYGRSFGSIEDLMSLTLDIELELVSPLAGSYDAYAAGRLELAGRMLYSVSFRRLHRGEVFCTTQVYLPPQVGQSLEDEPALLQVGHRSRMTIIGLLDSRGAGIQDAEQIITAVAARGEVAERLQAPSGSPLLHIERLYRDGAGHPVELAISDFLPEHYSRRLRLGRAVSYSVTAAGGGPSP
jgi:DNA-binding GntR family transcriptional regulator